MDQTPTCEQNLNVERKQRCLLPRGGHHIQSVYEFNSVTAAPAVIDYFFIEDSPVHHQVAASLLGKHLQAIVTMAKDGKESLSIVNFAIRL
jgi:hypothetical protein